MTMASTFTLKTLGLSPIGGHSATTKIIRTFGKDAIEVDSLKRAEKMDTNVCLSEEFKCNLVTSMERTAREPYPGFDPATSPYTATLTSVQWYSGVGVGVNYFVTCNL